MLWYSDVAQPRKHIFGFQTQHISTNTIILWAVSNKLWKRIMATFSLRNFYISLDKFIMHGEEEEKKKKILYVCICRVQTQNGEWFYFGASPSTAACFSLLVWWHIRRRSLMYTHYTHRIHVAILLLRCIMNILRAKINIIFIEREEVEFTKFELFWIIHGSMYATRRCQIRIRLKILYILVPCMWFCFYEIDKPERIRKYELLFLTETTHTGITRLILWMIQNIKCISVFVCVSFFILYSES